MLIWKLTILKILKNTRWNSNQRNISRVIHRDGGHPPVNSSATVRAFLLNPLPVACDNCPDKSSYPCRALDTAKELWYYGWGRETKAEGDAFHL